MGERELIALLNLSFWCLVMVERLFLAVPRGCLQFVIVVFPDHTHLLFLYIDLYMIFWFYFTCIKISPRQTTSSCSLASTLNLTCANDVTYSYDVIMRK